MTLFSSRRYLFSWGVLTTSFLAATQSFAMISDKDEAASSLTGAMKVVSTSEASVAQLFKRPSLRRTSKSARVGSGESRRFRSEPNVLHDDASDAQRAHSAPSSTIVQPGAESSPSSSTCSSSSAIIPPATESASTASTSSQSPILPRELTPKEQELAAILHVNCDYLIDKDKIETLIREKTKMPIDAYLKKFAECGLLKNGSERAEKERVSNQRHIAQYWYKKYYRPDWYITAKWYD